MAVTPDNPDEVPACPGCESSFFVDGSPSNLWHWRCHAGWCDIKQFGPRDETVAEVQRR